MKNTLKARDKDSYSNNSSKKLKDRIKIIDRKKLEDARGWFLKVIDGKEEKMPSFTGETYLTSATTLGQVRGNHYHHKASEWFTLIEGQAILKLQCIDSKEDISIDLCSRSPKTIFVPPRVAHAFVNITENPFLLLAYTDMHYDPKDTIVHILR